MMQQNALTVEDMCRKLRPVLGDKIDNIYLSYATADSMESKEEIAQFIRLAYQKHLSTLLNQNVFLEPPKGDIVKGDYPIGKIMYSGKEVGEFGLRDRDFPRHVCISGMSGSGKTTIAFQILKNFIDKGKPFLVFDWKKSFRPLLEVDKEVLCFTVGDSEVTNNFRVNINHPPRGVSPKSWITTLCDLLAESFSVSFGVHKVIMELLDRQFKERGVYDGSEDYPTWKQLKKLLEVKLESSRGREQTWVESALRIATVLTFGDFGEVVNSKKKDNISMEDLLNRKVIFELNALGNIEKKFFAEFILMYVYRMKKANQNSSNGEFDHAILVDEAHNIFLKDKTNFVSESVTDMVYREMREYGTSLICLDQHVSKLSDTVKGNSACHIAFQQQLPEDIRTISDLTRIGKEVEVFSNLPVGSAVVKLAERHTAPFMVQVPNTDLRNADVGDQYLKQRMLTKLVDYEAGRRPPSEQALDKEILENDELYEACWVTKSLVDMGKNIFEIKEELSKHYKNDNINKALKKFIGDKNPQKMIERATPEEKKLINFLIKNPYHTCSVTELYRQVGFSPRKGNAIKDSLIKKLVVRVEEVKYERGWRKFIRLY